MEIKLTSLHASTAVPPDEGAQSSKAKVVLVLALNRCRRTRRIHDNAYGRREWIRAGWSAIVVVVVFVRGTRTRGELEPAHRSLKHVRRSLVVVFLLLLLLLLVLLVLRAQVVRELLRTLHETCERAYRPVFEYTLGIIINKFRFLNDFMRFLIL